MERWNIFSVFCLRLWWVGAVSCKHAFSTLKVLCFERNVFGCEFDDPVLSSSGFVWWWEMQFQNQQWRKFYEICEMSLLARHISSPSRIKLYCFCGGCYIATVYDFYLLSMCKLVQGRRVTRRSAARLKWALRGNPSTPTRIANLCMEM